MKNELTEIEGRKVSFFISNDTPELILIEPTDMRSIDHMDGQIGALEGMVNKPFLFVAFSVEDWNLQLSPWEAPAVFGDEGFGGKGRETLAFVSESLIPEIRQRFCPNADKPMVIGGYSLAGLFSLWATYETDSFKGCAAASPSVWFPKWMEYVKGRKTCASNIYLSLGDREEKTKNSVMKTVGDNIRALSEIYSDSGIKNYLEWNEGNHFKDADIRTAKAFAWCINSIMPE